MSSPRTELWAAIGSEGWQQGHWDFATLYPMPPSRHFDEDGLFERIPLFPGPDADTPILAGHDEWLMPVSWFRSHETRPLSVFRHKFILKNGRTDSALAARLVVAVKKAVYLEMFRSRRPLALGSLRIRRNIYLKLADHALRVGKDLGDFTYADLADAIGDLNQVERGSLAGIYSLLRWWRATSPENYPWFIPPPQADEQTWSPTTGFDVSRVRGEPDADVDRRWQPLPDAFVAKLGEHCISLLEEARPLIIRCLTQIAGLPPRLQKSALKDAISSITWPQNYQVQTVRDFRSLSHRCQLAAICLVSLVLGARWSEISSIKRDSVRTVADGQVERHFLYGGTFKLSESTTGENRDWPLNPLIAKFIADQQSFVDLVEGASFPGLWRSHATAAGGGEPVRQIDGQLKKFAVSLGIENLLDGSSFHHHRFRKTMARLIVIALHGGPMILRRLFGHEHLAMTLRYILANDSIVEELREIAESEQRAIAVDLVENRDQLSGGGANGFNEAIGRIEAEMSVFVPAGKRDQQRTTSLEIVEAAAVDGDGLNVKQLLPGLVACYKPKDAAGACSKVGELPNVAKCDIACAWHLQMPGAIHLARANIQDALGHLRAGVASALARGHYERVIRKKIEAFPELRDEFEHQIECAGILGA